MNRGNNNRLTTEDSKKNETFVWNVYYLLNALKMPKKNKELNTFFIPLHSTSSSTQSENKTQNKETEEESSLTHSTSERSGTFLNSKL
jgi:hypothetical protein